MTPTAPDNHACAVCGGSDLLRPETTDAMQGVSSDGLPWPRIGTPALCRTCGHVMKLPSAQWREDVAAIYAKYRVYASGDGTVVRVFTGTESNPRTDVHLGLLRSMASLPDRGRMMDFGCGNGAFLHRFGALLPGWERFGYEPGGAAAPGAEGMTIVGGAMESIPHGLDLITMTHVLEHLENPRDVLDLLARRLSPNGVLFVAVPDLIRNPLDLAIVDHASHFTEATLARLLGNNGWHINGMDTETVPREIILTACRSGQNAGVGKAVPEERPEKTGLMAWAWLEETLNRARRFGADGMYVLGAGNAGTWLAANAPDTVLGFADEDESRQGREHAGHPVVAPRDVPQGARVFIPFPQPLANAIAERLSAARPDLSLGF